MTDVEKQIDIPRAWTQLKVENLRGILVVIGAPDVGKSTFARYLYQRLCAAGSRVAYLDGDPGQSILGPPATMTLAIGDGGDASFPPEGPRWRRFVGAVSPRGHMLPMLVNASRLAQAGQAAGVEVVIYDTSGLVNPAQGGTALKLAQIDLLQPTVVFALQHAHELETLLVPLRRSRRVRAVDVPPSPVARRREPAIRQANRASRFAAYFASAERLTINWTQLAVFPTPHFSLNRLAALEDVAGFTLGLGIVIDNDVRTKQLTLLTPLKSIEGVDALRLGDLAVDPQTFRDQRLNITADQTRAKLTTDGQA